MTHARLSWSGGLLLVFALSLGLRLLYLSGLLPVLETRQTPIYGDAGTYYLAAVDLAGGNPTRADVATPGQAAAWSPHHTRATLSIRGPAYIGFLASAFRLFGEDPWPVRHLQALLGALVCVLVGQLGREVAGRGAGLVAGLLAATYPSLILFSGRILSETLATFFFALALLGLVRGLRLESRGWLVGSGLCFGLGALTRPTLLAVVPFVALAAVLGSGHLPPLRRAALLALFVASLGLPLVAWNVAAGALGPSPVAGSKGLKVAAAAATTAVLPQFRGWRTDDETRSSEALHGTRGTHPDPAGQREAEWRQLLRDDPVYLVAALANLIFYHQWYLEDLWREVPPALHWLQRAIFLAALGGLGMLLLRWRESAPLWLLLVPWVLASLKWIEIRPNLSFAPLLFVLAGTFAAGLVELVRGAPEPARRGWLLAGGALATAGLVAACRPERLGRLLPSLDPIAVGVVADVGAIALALAWGGVLFALALTRFGRGGALLVGLVPSLTFALLFGSYVAVGSEPRWRQSRIDLGALARPVTQTIELPAGPETSPPTSRLWLVDLASAEDPPRLRVAVDGRWLPAEEVAWERLFCNPRAEIPIVGGRRRRLCSVYRRGLSDFTGAYESSPQWWGLRLSGPVTDDRRVTSLTLASEGPPSPETRVLLGVTFTSGAGSRFEGPSLRGLTAGPGSSLYRWHVAHDWRMWETTNLASRGSRSRIGDRPDAAAEDARFDKLDGLAGRMARGEAQWGIRLLERQRDGTWTVY